MKVETYGHPDHKHRYLITEESLHYDSGKRWILQQLNERGDILPREVPLTKEDYDKMVAQLAEQGWKTLLEG